MGAALPNSTLPLMVLLCVRCRDVSMSGHRHEESSVLGSSVSQPGGVGRGPRAWRKCWSSQLDISLDRSRRSCDGVRAAARCSVCCVGRRERRRTKAHGSDGLNQQDFGITGDLEQAVRGRKSSTAAHVTTGKWP